MVRTWYYEGRKVGEDSMTITELVEKHGLPVKVWIPRLPEIKPFTVQVKGDGFWLVNYENGASNHPISQTSLNDYELAST